MNKDNSVMIIENHDHILHFNSVCLSVRKTQVKKITGDVTVLCTANNNILVIYESAQGFVSPRRWWR